MRKHSRMTRLASLLLALYMAFGTATPAFADLFAFVTSEDAETGEKPAASGELNGGDGTYAVTVEYGEDAGLPEDVSIATREITPFDPEYETYYTLALEAAAAKEEEVLFARFFDIAIEGEDGKVQPESAVGVKIAVDELAELPEDAEISVFHFPDTNSENAEDELPEEPLSLRKTPLKAMSAPMTADGAETAESSDAPVISEPEAVPAEVSEDGAVVFEADGFSVYGVVGTEVVIVPFTDGDGRTYEVTVTYSKAAGIPEDAEFRVSEVTEDDGRYSEYLRQTAEAIGADAESLNYIKLLDISITKDGERVQPAVPVDVQIRLLDKEQAEETTQIVHFEGEDETPVVIDSTVEADAVSFETDGFSIYAVVDDGEGNETPARRRYHFIHLDESTGAIVPYYFYNSAGELVDNQIIKTGDVLEPINTPLIPDEKTWIGWRVAEIEGYDENKTDGKNYTSLSYGREVIFGEPLTVTEKEDIYLIPFYGDYHTITFIDYLFNGDKVTGYLIYNREEVPLGTTYDTTVQTVPNHKSVGDGDDADLVFSGWRLLHKDSEMTGFFEWNNGELTLKPGITWNQVDPTDRPDGHNVPGVTRNDDKFVIKIEMDPDQSRNYVLLPVYERAYWIEYNSAPAGSGATYVAPKHVRVGHTAAEAGAKPTVDMKWKGYEFQYWTTEETFDENGKPIEFASGSEPNEFNYNQVLAEDVKLNAYWKKAETTYTVMYWRQQLDDDKSLEGDDKHYDYAGQRTGTAEVDSTVTLTTADKNMNSVTYNGEDDDYLKYVGFSYAKDDTSTKTVNADGSTVINVYYDRNLITMNFDRDIESYTETEATTGTLYGVVNDEYVEITWNGTNWIYTTTEEVTQYVDYTGTRYNTTYSNVSPPQQYGVYNYAVVPLYRHMDSWPIPAHWSTKQDHTYNDDQRYNGMRYVIDSSGDYGFVNGAMVQLTNGQYSTTITQTVEHVYDGERYAKLTTRSFTGLYGQQLEMYGYQWPYEYVWRYDATGNATIGMSYLGQFILPTDVRDTSGKVINLRAQGSTTNYMEFYLQDPEKTDLNDVKSYVLSATGSADYSGYDRVNFTLSNKYEGYTVQGYRRYTGTGTNKTYIDTDIVPKQVDDSVQLKGFGYSYNLEVYYKVYSYNVTYKDPVSREVLSNYVFNYGADIDDSGAPAKSVVEDHVPTGYRLKMDGDGNIIWYADPNMEVEFNFDRTMPNHDLEVFPGFEPIYYWIKIEPNGGELSATESTWFWKRHGDTSVSEYTDAVRNYIVDEDGDYYYHYDEFTDPDADVNQYGTQVRKAEYRLKSDYTGEGTWLNDSYDGKSYSPSSVYELDGWYEVTTDPATGAEVLIPYHFGSPIIHNTTLRAVWFKTGSYSTVYKTEGVDKDGNPLFTYTVGDKTYLVKKNSNDSYTYTDDNGQTQTVPAGDAGSLPRLTGSDAPFGGRMYEDEANTIILHRPDPPAGYVCTGYYFNGTVYIPGNVFRIDSTLDGADGHVDTQFTFYPIYEPISDRNVQVTNVYFVPNADDLSKVTMDSSLEDKIEDGVQKQRVDSTQKTVAFLNRQVNKELTLLGAIYTREGYTLKGWSLTSGVNNHVDFELDQEHVAADNLSREGNTDANTLYAVWEIKKYTLTVEKDVDAGDLTWDHDHRFTFSPKVEYMQGEITQELQDNFSLTGNSDAGTNVKTFETKIPYGSSISITEAPGEKWSVTYTVEVTKDGADEPETSPVKVGGEAQLSIDGDVKVTFTNKMDNAAATISIIKTNENGSSAVTIKGITDGDYDDIVLSGAKFTLLRKAKSDGNYTQFLEDITVNRYTTLSLPQGYYQLIETQSPDGYIIATKTWEFVVTYEGGVYAQEQPGMFFRNGNGTSDSRNRVSDESFIITNQPGSALPMTGNSGTKIYIISGIALLFAAAVVNEIRLRRKEEQ